MGLVFEERNEGIGGKKIGNEALAFTNITLSSRTDDRHLAI